MDDFQAKSRWRRLFYSRPVVIILALLVVALARPVWNIWRKSQAVAQEQSQVAAQLAELEARKAFLEKEIKELGTPRGIEGEIREKFPVVKEGEKVIIVADDVATSSATSSVSTTSWWPF